MHTLSRLHQLPVPIPLNSKSCSKDSTKDDYGPWRIHRTMKEKARVGVVFMDIVSHFLLETTKDSENWISRKKTRGHKKAKELQAQFLLATGDKPQRGYTCTFIYIYLYINIYIMKYNERFNDNTTGTVEDFYVVLKKAQCLYNLCCSFEIHPSVTLVWHVQCFWYFFVLYFLFELVAYVMVWEGSEEWCTLATTNKTLFPQ